MGNSKIPVVGWRTVGSPCAECLLILERESEKMNFPGRAVRCYACDNHMTTIRTEKEGVSIHDRFSGMSAYEESVREYKLVEVLFQRSKFTDHGMQQWLQKNELDESFAHSGRKGTEWDVFTKTASPEACVFVHLQEGIIGRCVLDVAAV